MSLRDLVATAVAELHHGAERPMLACRHAFDQTPDPATGEPPPLTMCAQHPAAGIACPACQGDHLARHDATRPCDVCAASGGPFLGRTAQIETAGLALTHPQLGDALVLVGVVHLVGVVVCASCATRDPSTV